MNYFVLSNVNHSNEPLNLDFGVNTKSEIKEKVYQAFRQQTERAKRLGFTIKKSYIDEQSRVWNVLVKGDKTVKLVVCNDKNRGLL